MNKVRRRRMLAVVVLLGLIPVACRPPDAAVGAAVQVALATDPRLRSYHLRADALRGVVTLTGETATREEQGRAVEVARQVRGVREVRNGLRLTDAGIAASVRRARDADPVLRPLGIAIEVERGVVRLWCDNTTKDQRERAVRLVSVVDGVLAVEDRMK